MKTPLEKTIAFIGGGNMGEAMVAALIAAGLVTSNRILVSEARPERCAELATTYGIAATGDNTAAFAAADVVILAVKPQQMNTVLAAIAEGTGDVVAGRKLVVSVAAGVPIARLEGLLYPRLADPSTLPIIRVMPNTPALVRCAMSVMSPNRHVQDEDLDLARTLLGAMGEVIAMQEAHLDAVTALSGSGPAYLFYLAEAMIQAGLDQGLSNDDSYALTLQTLKGAVALMAGQNLPPAELRRRVTSPGGTTEAAVRVLENNRVGQNIVSAIRAAAERSRQLSG